MKNQTVTKVFAGIVALLAFTITQNVRAQDQTDARSHDNLLEEVVVTAQKRGVQNVQDVSVCILVMGGDQLDPSLYEGVNDSIAGIAGVITNGTPSDPSSNEADSFDKVVLRAVLNWFVNEDLTTYASFATGFRSDFIQGECGGKLPVSNWRERV